MLNTNGGWSNVTAIGLITFIQFIYLVIYFQCFCLPRRLWVEGYRTEMDLFTLALIILLGVLMFVSTRLGIITIHQHHHHQQQHHHHHHHDHYSPASSSASSASSALFTSLTKHDLGGKLGTSWIFKWWSWYVWHWIFLTLPFIRKCQDFGRYVLPTKFLFGKVTLWKRSLAKTCLDALPISLLDWHGSHW